MRLYRLEALRSDHDSSAFDCGDADINEYLREHGLRDMELGLARTWILVESGEPATAVVAGFVTLRAHALHISNDYFGFEDDDGPPLEVPLVELMYVARDLRWKGRDLGPVLVIQALRIVARVADLIGIIGVHLRSTTKAVPLYEAFDFSLFRAHPTYDPARYLLPIADVRAIVARTAELLP
jgi:hypothetical protein